VVRVALLRGGWSFGRCGRASVTEQTPGGPVANVPLDEEHRLLLPGDWRCGADEQ
jgi:hypothetical protein